MILAQVFAVGKRVSLENKTLGWGKNPRGGTRRAPVANIKISSILEAAFPSAKEYNMVL